MKVLKIILCGGLIASTFSTSSFARRHRNKKIENQSVQEKKHREPLWGFLGGLGAGSIIAAASRRWYFAPIGAGTGLLVGAAIASARKRRAQRKEEQNHNNAPNK